MPWRGDPSLLFQPVTEADDSGSSSFGVGVPLTRPHELELHPPTVTPVTSSTEKALRTADRLAPLSGASR